MGRTKTTRGNGITAEEIVKYDGEDIAQALKQFCDDWNAAIDEGGGDFGAVTLSAMRGFRIIVKQEGKGPHVRDSIPWFAQQIVQLHNIAKAEIARGNADSAARFAYEMGVLVERVRMKSGWEPAALTGQKVRHETPGAIRGGRQKGQTLARDVALAKEFLARRSRSRLSDTALKASLGADHGLSRSASIDAVNRGLKKVSG
ncbi:hypothetical protein ACLB6G_05740 [Zhengella sp. ZM62]|uniref:hypothetical protein n=1 Tax=Zhengella sedimenti TaxID=3390035 RepID=UPI003975E038